MPLAPVSVPSAPPLQTPVVPTPILQPTPQSTTKNESVVPTSEKPAEEEPPHPPELSALATGPTPLSTAEDRSKKEQDEIAKILKEVKLPERHQAAQTSGAQPQENAGQKLEEPKRFDTTLGAAAGSFTDNKTPPSSTLDKTVPAEISLAGESVAQKEHTAPSSVTPLHTLKDDLQEVVRVKKVSLVHAAALEEEKRFKHSAPETKGNETSRSRRTRGILFAAALLLFLGVAAFFGVSLIAGDRGTPIYGSLQNEILFSENTVSFELGNNSSIDLKRLLFQARQGAGGTLGSITRIVPTRAEAGADGTLIDRPATLEEFLTALGSRAPTDLYRALSSEFFFGLHTVDENAPLFVIPVTSYERAFAAMLRWEDTLNADFAPAFTSVSDQIIGTSGLPEKRRFNDLVMRNYDVRALEDDNGTIELYYAFPTRNLLVIAESPYSFTEILSRLRAERKL